MSKSPGFDPSVMSPLDLHQEICDRVRWAEAMLQVLIADEAIQEIHCEAIAGIAGHLSDATEKLDELRKDVRDAAEPPPAKKPQLVPIRKAAPADQEPEQGGAA